MYLSSNKAFSTTCRRLFPAARAIFRGGRDVLRLMVVSAVVLAQLELLWLAGFHYHGEFSASRESPSGFVSPGSQQRNPGAASDSCPLCLIIRHNISRPAAVTLPVFDPFLISGVTLPATAKLLVTAHVRLSGRDPPLSFPADC